MLLEDAAAEAREPPRFVAGCQEQRLVQDLLAIVGQAEGALIVDLEGEIVQDHLSCY